MPKSRQALTAAIAFGVAVLLATTHAQVGRGGSEWLTARGDAQRTSWIRSDALISVASMSKPGFELQWKKKLDNASRGTFGLGQGVSANGVTLFVPMAVVTGSSNNVYAIDTDMGHVVWERHFDAPMRAATDACPGGTTSAATRIVALTPPAGPPATVSFGRASQGYHSVIGEPGEGAPVEVRARGGAAPGRGAEGAGRAQGAGARGAAGAAGGAGNPGAAGAAGAGAGGAAGAGAGGAAGAGAPPRGGGFGGPAAPPIPGAPADQFARGGLGRPSGVVYVISSDGMLHVMGLPSGKDIQKPAPFVPANSRWSDPIAVGTMLYTSTSGGCGGAPDAVWAIDLAGESKPVISWKSDAPIVGSLAFTTDGTLLVSTTSTIVALDSKTLKVARTFSPPGSELVTGPAILRQGDHELVAVAAKNGHVSITRAGETGSPWLPVGPVQLAVDALATWQDATNALWVLVPTDHSVVASGVDDSGGARWTAVNLTLPATPLIVNGVVFVLEHGSTGVLHAYDGTTGKEFWTSGKTITAAAAPGSFWSANGQVYVGAMDGTLYAFGFTDERR